MTVSIAQSFHKGSECRSIISMSVELYFVIKLTMTTLVSSKTWKSLNIINSTNNEL